MKKTEWTITGWSLPDFRMVHIIIKNTKTGIEKSRTYQRMASFETFMFKHGLFNEDCINIEKEVWG